MAGQRRKILRLLARDVSKTFTGADGGITPALDRLTLSIDDGEFVSIVGPSGCGKSTFLSCVAGITQFDSGTLSIGGQQVSGPGTDRAVVFQDPSLLPWRNTFDNIGYGMAVQRVKSATERKRRTAELIEFVGLAGFEKHYPAQLSGGMRQRANLARALATDPELLLMDEPFAALDAQTREQLQLELGRIWQQNRSTVLFITHDIEEAVFLSDRVVAMTGRPGTVRATIEIDLPRPRAAGLKRTGAFAALEEQIWGLMHSIGSPMAD